MTRKPNGFTLLELLVATSLTIILLLGVSSVFMTFMLGEARTNVRRQVQSEGAEIISRMEFLLRNSRALTSCSSGSSISFTTMDGDGTNTVVITHSYPNVKYRLDKVDPNTGAPISGAEETINPSDTVIENLSFQCSQDATTQKRVVVISFQAKKTKSGVEAKEIFKSYVQLRNS